MHVRSSLSGTGIILLLALCTMPAGATSTELVSISSDGAQGDLDGRDPSTSADGRIVAFASAAITLVPDDTNQCAGIGCFDVFIRDRDTNLTERVSVASDGSQGNGDSFDTAISADGRFVAFRSYASNLVPDDTNGVADVFVHDRVIGTTERVSVDSKGRQGNSGSEAPALSGDGRFVAFRSAATNLAARDRNGFEDVFVHDRTTGKTWRVSVDSQGREANDNSAVFAPAISADGRFVAFDSFAGNLVAGDTNYRADVFAHDCLTGTTSRVSVNSAGQEASFDSFGASLSADGRFVAFQSLAPNLVAGDTNGMPDVFVRDRTAGTTERVSVGSDGSEGTLGSGDYPSVISADGQKVAFESQASNLVPQDTNGVQDVFVHNRITGTTSRVSVAGNERQGNADSGSSALGISADGRSIVFQSYADNLVRRDRNATADVFVHED